MTARQPSGGRGSDGNGKMPHWFVWGGVLVLGVLVGVMAFHALTPAEDGEMQEGLQEVDSIGYDRPENHVHGVGYDGERDHLFIATHFGLFRLHDTAGEAGSLFQLGDNRDDFMGFSLDPHDGERMFASGHPASGGNLGVIRSTDGGSSWDPVYSGPQGHTLDFHAMALSAADPDRLAGVWAGSLFVTLDEGDTWDIPGQLAGGGHCWSVACVAWDSEEPDTLWLGNRTGLYTSPDVGASWSQVVQGAHAAVYAHPADGRLWAWSVDEGLQVSSDDGESWQAGGEGLPAPDPAPTRQVFQFTGPPDDPEVSFAVFLDSEVYRTLDGGKRWQRIYPLS